MTNAIITVRGYQYINGEEDVIELKTQGKFGLKDGKFYIKYSEQDEFGVETQTLIKVSDSQTLLQRSGGTESRMVVEVGKRNCCLYSAQGAGLMLEIYGEHIENGLTCFGGNLTLEYSILTNSTLLSQNKTEITVKEV